MRSFKFTELLVGFRMTGTGVGVLFSTYIKKKKTTATRSRTWAQGHTKKKFITGSEFIFIYIRFCVF